jgi:hypothetical protein
MAKGDFAKQQFTTLPTWAKGVIAVAVIGGVAFATYKFYKLIKDTSGGKAAGDRQEDRGWNKEFDNLNSNPNTKATLTQAGMLAAANALHAAMDGYATDEDAIVSIFKNQVKNSADFAGVSAAYGIRELSSGTWNPAPNFKGTLAGALSEELSQYWKDLINKDLASKKITYKV